MWPRDPRAAPKGQNGIRAQRRSVSSLAASVAGARDPRGGCARALEAAVQNDRPQLLERLPVVREGRRNRGGGADATRRRLRNPGAGHCRRPSAADRGGGRGSVPAGLVLVAVPTLFGVGGGACGIHRRYE